MKKSYYFVSDLHFGLQSGEEELKLESLFVEFLNSIKDSAAELFILGDLFDYWFEYRNVIQKGYYRTFTALNNLTNAGVKVNYIIGNHDFMHRNFFETDIGLTLYQDSIEREIENKKFYLAHGDGLVKNDIGYLILKKILRSKFIQSLYSFVHPDFGIWIAKNSSKTSREYTTNKHYGERDGLFDFAKKKIDESFDYVLLGHTHNRSFEKYNNGYYINLGTWLDKPCFGQFKNGEFKIVDWK